MIPHLPNIPDLDQWFSREHFTIRQTVYISIIHKDLFTSTLLVLLAIMSVVRQKQMSKQN